MVSLLMQKLTFAYLSLKMWQFPLGAIVSYFIFIFEAFRIEEWLTEYESRGHMKMPILLHGRDFSDKIL